MTAFRDATAQLSADVDALAARRQAEAATIPTGADSMYVRRTARVAFGVTGVVGAAVIVASMALGMPGQLVMLVAAWGLALVAYGIALALASRSLRRALAWAVTPTGEPHHDLALLRAVSPRRLALDLDRKRGLASQRWPLVAAALLGPHTLHAVMPAVLFESFNGFDRWMTGSALLCLPVFAYAVLAAWRFPTIRRPHRDVLIATALAILPGLLTVGIAIVLTFLTAAPLAVVTCGPMGRIIDREQARLAAAEAALLDEAELA